MLVAVEQPHAGVLTGRAADPAVNVQEHLRDIRETLFSPPVLEGVIRECDLYDLAKRLSLPLATRDFDLEKAALSEGIAVLGR